MGGTYSVIATVVGVKFDRDLSLEIKAKLSICVSDCLVRCNYELTIFYRFGLLSCVILIRMLLWIVSFEKVIIDHVVG